MSSKKILTFISFLIIFFSNTGKVYSIEPDIFVQSTVNRAAKTLGGNFTKKERIEKLKMIASETVDIIGIGYYTLGSYRKNIGNKQIKEYEVLFEQYFLKSFSSRAHIFYHLSRDKLLLVFQLQSQNLLDAYFLIK